MKYSVALMFVLVVIPPVLAQPANTLIHYNFNGQMGDQVSSPGTSLVSGVTSTSIVRGSGINGTTLSNSMNSYGWSTAASVNTSHYYSFQVSVAEEQFLYLSGLQFRIASDPNGPQQIQLAYSLDNFQTPGTVISTRTIARGSTSIQSYDLSGYSNLQFLAQNSTVEFRLYGYESQLTPLTIEEGADERLARQMAFVNTASSSLDISASGVFVMGTVSPVPEPGLMIAIAASGLAGMRMIRKLRRNRDSESL